MYKAITSTILSFAVGCMIFMVSGLEAYWNGHTHMFDEVVKNYDSFVFGIFIIGVVGGGLGHFIYRINIAFQYQTLLHYGSTVVTILIVAFWLKIISIELRDVLEYGLITSVIFMVVWYANYAYLKKEANRINEIIKMRAQLK